MAILTLAARRVQLSPSCAALRSSRRHLGEGVRGPAITDVVTNAKLACDFFTSSPVSYVQFRQRCMSLRIFAFAGVNLFVVGALFMDPPKSSYWTRYSPTFLFYNIRMALMGTRPPIFLTEKVEYSVNVPDVADQLITTRRLNTAGSDSEDE
mmetsp:Transcript_3157/g.7117  ORF Transcript_3157/g.7117 Transcript_3157/m.7117 type:complete len:152 (+) Transcript_3157:117-572(+)|eukprot:CAMPEP_0178426914 /NCGR_PEP_ID=MMETSP0689_2-20121128/29476_1 /TAXON_ID=160604 /ORGANISM="Amphidinium massartii, Strain CS-259" /LENGTH=151 /DNA_ID=CAMNT_0020048607 /DNA_START=117 /DNA_END=572 /DNA_ORIENTATION=+